ncbi:MAG: hypothetical protein IPL50_20945 [Chitinophagaceae bacterium]|nr:hypothetical protein [Chitinophagaceae bacterium]
MDAPNVFMPYKLNKYAKKCSAENDQAHTDIICGGISFPWYLGKFNPTKWKTKTNPIVKPILK